MTARKDTREALLRAGVELFIDGGYDYVGTNAILARAGVPRGSFYHHFTDKLDFAIATAQHYYDQHLPLLDRILTEDSQFPLARLRRYFETLRNFYRDRRWTGGCLLGMLSQELPDREGKARAALATIFSRWRHRLVDCLREAQGEGQIAKNSDLEELAAFLIDGWEGALLAMKITRSGAPLDRFIRICFDQKLIS
ncbi:MAG: TetR family transcriptional regulator C-terminal domain-containing protein [Polyangia bacterium]|jgi:TetR/AcrR family transcriptional repressor of nem operon